MDFVGIILTSLLSVVALFVITKMMGHKQVAQLDFFDYVTGITIGSVAAELATDLESPERPLVAMAVYGVVSILLSFITRKMPKSRKYINGTPTILFDAGKLYRDNIRKCNVELSEFLLLCREAGYFSLDEIETAIFECNGKLSILPKEESRPLTPKDVGITPKQKRISTELIMDGKILGENLKRLGLSEQWLKKEILKNGFSNAKEVLFADLDSEGNTRIYPQK
jgi:uncharacterized membrane protein YcaP (DUF421 family)